MKSIKKQHLKKVKSMASPPPRIKMALEEATALRKPKAGKIPQTGEVIMEAGEKTKVEEGPWKFGLGAITCYLYAYRHQNESKSWRYLAKALGMLMLTLTYETGQLEAVDKHRKGVPPSQGLPGIPQQLTYLVRREGKLILNLISQGDRMFPQAGHA